MIETGNITDINEKYKNWFLGPFVEEGSLNTRNSSNFEVKWSKRKKGYFHPPKDAVVKNDKCRSMVICVYGEVSYTFIDDTKEDQKFLLKNEGDYIIWSPNINHKVSVSEDALILTIRWYN